MYFKSTQRIKEVDHESLSSVVDRYFTNKIIRNNKNMLFKIILLIAVTYVYAVEYTLENCKCGEGFEAKKDDKGKVQCQGKLLDEIKHCNIPEPPKCVCTQEKAIGILTDLEGTWCTHSKKGKEKKKWPCENKEEWDAYKIAHENFKKSLIE